MREHTQRQAHTYMTHTQTLTRTHTHTHTHTVVSTPDRKKKYEMVGHAQYLSKESRSFVLALSSGFFWASVNGETKNREFKNREVSNVNAPIKFSRKSHVGRFMWDVAISW